MTAPFLTASWDDLVLASFVAPAELLQGYLPRRTELDSPDAWPHLTLVTVVALRFRHMRVRGLPVPTAGDVPEVNLRFYARHGQTRGAVFLREYVGHPLVVAGARLLYGEPYRLARVGHEVVRDRGSVRSRTVLQTSSGRGTMEVIGAGEPLISPESGVEHWLKEHYWGFGRSRSGDTIRYRVAHPVWRTYRVVEARVGIDPGLLMGGRWRTIDWASRLHSVVLAEGSAASVYPSEPLPDG